MHKIKNFLKRFLFKLKMNYLRLKYRNKTIKTIYPKLYKPGIVNYVRYKIYTRKVRKYIKEKYNL